MVTLQTPLQIMEFASVVVYRGEITQDYIIDKL